jgi:hypothetical protein
MLPLADRLAAWIIDTFRDWSDGDLDSRIDKDTLLTTITLYWVTGSIGSSFRQYFDWEHNTARPDITVPAALHAQCRTRDDRLPA